MFIICPYISIIKYFLHLPILQIPIGHIIESQHVPAIPVPQTRQAVALAKGKRHRKNTFPKTYVLITC